MKILHDGIINMKNVLVIGSVNIDTTVYLDDFPNEGETVIGCNKLVQIGGKGANQAVAIANSGLSHCVFKCAVGDDQEGKTVLKELSKYSLKVDHKISKEPTGAAYIEVNMSSQNKIIVVSGANNDLSEKDIKDSIFDNVDCVVLQNEICMKTNQSIMKKAKSLGKTVIYNPAPFKSIDKSFLKYVDYFIPNEIELEQYTNTKDIKAAANKVLTLGCKNVVVTLGSKGSVLFSKGETIETKAYKVKAVDTVSAGDTFVGYFASALMSGVPLKEALKIASKAASICVTRKGSLMSIPKGNEVKI